MMGLNLSQHLDTTFSMYCLPAWDVPSVCLSGEKYTPMKWVGFSSQADLYESLSICTG